MGDGNNVILTVEQISSLADIQQLVAKVLNAEADLRRKADEAHKRLNERVRIIREKASVREQLEAMAGWEPIDFQQTHSPTERVEIVRKWVVDPGSGEARAETISGVRRRVIDTKLWDAMSTWQQEATEAIARGFLAVVGDVACRTGLVEIRGGDGRPVLSLSDHDVAAVRHYRSWARRCKVESPDALAATLSVVVFARSCVETDKLYRHRNGWARGALFEGLDLYCRLRGWGAREKDRE